MLIDLSLWVLVFVKRRNEENQEFLKRLVFASFLLMRTVHRVTFVLRDNAAAGEFWLHGYVAIYLVTGVHNAGFVF